MVPYDISSVAHISPGSTLVGVTMTLHEYTQLPRHPVERAIICSLGVDWPIGCYYQICVIFLRSQSF